MKTAYPIAMRESGGQIVVIIPDFDIGTQGANIADAMEMARDAIGLIGTDMEDEKEALPAPSEIFSVVKSYPNQTVTLVDVDFAEYRRKNDLRTVRRNVSLPSWLNAEADRRGLNVSAILQAALKQEISAAL
ncbi:MAG: type II toxin-antitoxin system HicB family antitoxin [Clostridiales bacterium]|nr:type II toxin-antitoxin system HicB family antitoxin [Clostridiales bacterium]